METDFERSHQQTQLILARYVEKLKLGADVAKMYPEIELHLQGCAHCRAVIDALLAETLSASAAQSAMPISSPLPFLDTRQNAASTIRPGSTWSSFGIHIAVSSPNWDGWPVPDQYGCQSANLRGQGSVLPGGRLIYSGRHYLDDIEMHVLLILQPGNSLNEFQIIGEVYCDNLPIMLNAQLRVGDQVLFAQLEDHKFQFGTLTCPHDLESITLSIETPDA